MLFANRKDEPIWVRENIMSLGRIDFCLIVDGAVILLICKFGFITVKRSMRSMKSCFDR